MSEKKEELLQVPGTITKVTSMANRRQRIQIDTQENLSDEQIVGLSPKIDKFGWFVFLEDKKIQPDQVMDLPALPVKRDEEKKSPSRRLHDVLYIYWKQQGSQGDFEVFYRGWMDSKIDQIKETLN